MWCREVCLSGLLVVADLWKDDPLHVTGAVFFCLICEWTMPLSQLRTLPPLHTSAVSWHSKDHGIRASLLHDPSVSRTSALRRSSKKWCDQCFVRFFTSRCWYNYDDNGYNNSLALYLHYLSLILMLFIVLLARGMSDHSVMSLLAKSLSLSPSVISVMKRHTWRLIFRRLPTLPPNCRFDHRHLNRTKRFLHVKSTRSHKYRHLSPLV